MNPLLPPAAFVVLAYAVADWFKNRVTPDNLRKSSVLSGQPPDRASGSRNLAARLCAA
jgi:hypothetical protein